MKDELLQLRQNTYQAAAKFHRAMSDYHVALGDRVLSKEIKQIAADCRTTGERYSSALHALLENLKTRELESMETHRVLRLLDLMDLELILVADTEDDDPTTRR